MTPEAAPGLAPAAPAPDPTAPWPGLPAAPRSVDISLTGRCNLRCRYCFYADEMAALADLPTARWLGVFAELGALGVQRVCLSGGEVFTRPDLFTLVDGVIAQKMRYSLLTNGTLVDDAAVAAFGVGRRRLRLDSIQVSVDGSCAAVHDASRPPRSFDRALAGLRRLKAAGLPVTVRVTVNRHNVDDLEGVARLLLEEVGLPGFSTNEAEPVGAARCPGQDVVLTAAERGRAMATLTALTARYGGRIGAQAGPLARARHFAEIEAGLDRGERGRPGRGTLGSCGGVFGKMAILHDGTLVPCNLLPSLSMGVAGETPIGAAWRCHPAIHAVRQRRQVPLAALPACQGCPYTGFCAGGCPAVGLAQQGRLDVVDPLICYRRHVAAGEAPA